jgi:hypothetical protein
VLGKPWKKLIETDSRKETILSIEEMMYVVRFVMLASEA